MDCLNAILNKLFEHENTVVSEGMLERIAYEKSYIFFIGKGLSTTKSKHLAIDAVVELYPTYSSSYTRGEVYENNSREQRERLRIANVI